MDTKKKFGLTKAGAILLFLQMLLTVLLFAASAYLLAFVISRRLGGWMIASYVCIITSITAIIVYSVYGYKKGDIAYQVSVLPFLAAVFVNILLPSRSTLQVALLTLLFALTFAFLLRQKDQKFTNVIAILMVGVSLVFSVHAAIHADTQFLGPVSSNWPTYAAMYLSIFVPSVMSGTLALTYHVRTTR